MIQRNAELVGAYGCYFLAILHLAEGIIGETIDPLRAYLYVRDMDWMSEECFVNEPSSILSYFSGAKWRNTKEAADYETHRGELEILRFELRETMTTKAHFVVGDGSGNVQWDPYGNSVTVNRGTLVSKRIFRRVA